MREDTPPQGQNQGQGTAALSNEEKRVQQGLLLRYVVNGTLRRLYKKTKNPAYVWRAFDLCLMVMRDGFYPDQSLPPWVIDYFQITIDEIRWLDMDETSRPAEVSARVAAALGFVRRGQGVRSSAFSDAGMECRDLDLATRVRESIEEDPDLPLPEHFGRVAALELVNVETGEPIVVSEDIVERAWEKWRDFEDE